MKADFISTSIFVTNDKKADSIGNATTDVGINTGFSGSLYSDGAGSEEMGQVMTNFYVNEEFLHVESAKFDEIGKSSADINENLDSQGSFCDERAQSENITEKSSISNLVEICVEGLVVDAEFLENKVFFSEKDIQSNVDILLSTFSHENAHSPSTSDTIENEDCIPSPPWSSDFDTASHLQDGDISSKEDLWNDSLVIDECCAGEFSVPEKSFDPAEESVVQLKRLSEKFDYDRKRLQDFYVRRIRECLLNPPYISRERCLKSANSWIDKFKQEQV